MKGNKGVKFNDRELAGKVRNMGLRHLERILSEDYKDKKFQREIISKIANSLLPRINEHSGPEGKPIPISNVFVNHSDSQDSEAKEAD